MTDDIKAIRDALADVSRDGPHYFDWLGAATPERIARLLDALEQAQAECAAWRARATRAASLAQSPAAMSDAPGA